MAVRSPILPVYVVAAAHPWNRRIFRDRLAHRPGRWYLVSRPDQLTPARMAVLRPRYIFLLHWSWKVPPAITRAYECVGFHMTDLPFGRGGSPLQHLMLRGCRRTKLSAMRLTDRMDAGPIYAKTELRLSGPAQYIYRRASRAAAAMIGQLIRHPRRPVPQRGRVMVFRRRTPPESRIVRPANLSRLYDFIRMLDADGYPRAFLESDGVRYEFSDARLRAGRIEAAVRIVPVKRGNR